MNTNRLVVAPDRVSSCSLLRRRPNATNTVVSDKGELFIEVESGFKHPVINGDCCGIVIETNCHQKIFTKIFFGKYKIVIFF